MLPSWFRLRLGLCPRLGLGLFHRLLMGPDRLHLGLDRLPVRPGLLRRSGALLPGRMAAGLLPLGLGIALEVLLL